MAVVYVMQNDCLIADQVNKNKVKNAAQYPNQSYNVIGNERFLSYLVHLNNLTRKHAVICIFNNGPF